MDIRFDQVNDIIIVTLHGKLETATVENLSLELDQYMNIVEIKVLVDLSDLVYVSSAGMSLLQRLAKSIKDNKGDILFCSAPQFIRESFDIVGFNQLLNFVDTRDDGISILRQLVY
ncbi:MAG TPA: STAS domain-containing protein [Candidatus Cloacimonadota bacterium]|nr:STAS domain-containing protein [Candidatus Cloacimonadota bacterium]HPT72448.1 STAS domain-containing protein [Candidatus Cloacimonadota bacterium]